MPQVRLTDKGLHMQASSTAIVIPFPPRGSFCQPDLFLASSTTPASTGTVDEARAQSIEHRAAAKGLRK
jgi:hypothetical protein